MADSKEEQIARLLHEGLERYGSGEEVLAVQAWSQVLELDPENAEARDFIQSAHKAAGENSIDLIVSEARRMLAEERYEEAHTVLRSGPKDESGSLELESLIELTRVRLAESYRRQLGDLAAVPIVRQNVEAIADIDLPPNAGFLLSLLDGSTAIGDVVTLSGMDAFEALRTLTTLVNAGVVELQA